MNTLRWIGPLAVLLSTVAFAQDYVPGEVIVKFKSKAKASAAQNFLGKVSNKASVKASLGRLNMHHLALKGGQSVEQAIADFQQDPDIEYVEPNYILRIADVVRDDDRVFSASDVQAMAAATYTQSYAATKVADSWGVLSSTMVTPIVAVVDTGVDYNHTVFTQSGAIWSNPGETGTDSNGNNKSSNGIDDDGNGYIDDYRGWNFYARNNNPMDDDEHGTHVAGIILGVGQDIFASPVAAAKIRIMPLKFLGAGGSGSTADAITAIYYAANNGANVINNSWGGSNYSQSLHDALTYAYNKQVTLVSAAGNYTSNNDSTDMYPANYPVPSMISVAATNDSDTLASFSNYGKSKVHVAAPGVGILSTTPSNSYRYLSGTSMASPFVAGMAAMAFREASNLSSYQIRNVIINTVDSVSGLSTKISTSGRVNAYASVQNAKSNVNVQSSQPSYTATAPTSRAPAAAASSDGGGGGGCGLISSVAGGVGLGGGSKGSGNPMTTAMVVVIMALPMMVWLVLRNRQRQRDRNRRQHERFVMNSDIRLKVGGRELEGQMKTISEGGLSFCADSMLEKGGVVTLTITSPDGQEQVQVQGHIVWNEKNSAYGVQFDQAREGVLGAIRAWTRNLVKAN